MNQRLFCALAHPLFARLASAAHLHLCKLISGLSSFLLSLSHILTLVFLLFSLLVLIPCEPDKIVMTKKNHNEEDNNSHHREKVVVAHSQSIRNAMITIHIHYICQYSTDHHIAASSRLNGIVLFLFFFAVTNWPMSLICRFGWTSTRWNQYMVILLA